MDDDTIAQDCFIVQNGIWVDGDIVSQAAITTDNDSAADAASSS
jgi:hypothetical protein